MLCVTFQVSPIEKAWRQPLWHASHCSLALLRLYHLSLLDRRLTLAGTLLLPLSSTILTLVAGKYIIFLRQLFSEGCFSIGSITWILRSTGKFFKAWVTLSPQNLKRVSCRSCILLAARLCTATARSEGFSTSALYQRFLSRNTCPFFQLTFTLTLWFR